VAARPTLVAILLCDRDDAGDVKDEDLAEVAYAAENDPQRTSRLVTGARPLAETAIMARWAGTNC
jgi:hypothetical protein